MASPPNELPAESGRPPGAPAIAAWGRRPIALVILLSFVLTFLLARVMVLLIMTHRIPSLYLHFGRTHVHHLNYGIFILSAVGAVLLLRQPQGRSLLYAAAIYGVGLALTFDEFGMWVHLGGPYWQRASFDAVIVIASLFGLYLLGPSLQRFGQRHWMTLAILVFSFAVFAVILADSLRFARQKFSPVFQQIEAGGPP